MSAAGGSLAARLSASEAVGGSRAVSVERALLDGRPVLVKRLTSAGARDPSATERLEREGDIVQRLDHPNIPRLVAREPGLLAYELHHGQDLEAALASGPLERGRGLAVVRAVLGALAHAHGRGVIHLDAKPANILLEPLDGRERVLLADFGCAKDLQAAAITSLDARLGTPHYMAPEQFDGRRDDPRSDVYSAGAVLYELLVGQPPHPDPFAWLLGRSGSPERWPDDPALAAVCRRALERDPAHRYADALEMLTALEASGA